MSGYQTVKNGKKKKIKNKVAHIIKLNVILKKFGS